MKKLPKVYNYRSTKHSFIMPVQLQKIQCKMLLKIVIIVHTCTKKKLPKNQMLV